MKRERLEALARRPFHMGGAANALHREGDPLSLETGEPAVRGPSDVCIGVGPDLEKSVTREVRLNNAGHVPIGDYLRINEKVANSKGGCLYVLDASEVSADGRDL